MHITIFLPAVVTFVVTMAVYPLLIQFLHKVKFGQSIREEGPKAHHKKTGTPTMGGIGFVVISICITIIFGIFFKLDMLQISMLSVVFLAYCFIGLADDVLIVVHKKNDGLSPKHKLIAQLLVAVIFVAIFITKYDTTIALPFIRLDIGLLYIPFVLLMFVAESNAVNLTDGIDGLCASVYMVALVPFGIIAYIKQEYAILLFIACLFSALLAYYQFNKNPAKVFMGDTGSLALGGVLAAIAAMLKVEILLVVIGGVFLIETLSVMIQVAYYKKTKKRIFLMSPIHHHYELKGMNEKQIVRMFSFTGIVFALLGVLLWLMF